MDSKNQTQKREIKFRAWHKVEKKLCPIDVLTTKGAFLIGVENGPDELTNGGKTIIISPKNGRFCMNEDIELMQFTGLHDKNGKEIYEGDIVHIEYFKMAVGENLGVYETEAELKGVVEFDGLSLILQNIVGEKWQEYTGYDAGEGKCKFMYLGDVYEGSLDASYQMEIIGNIYENPELLSK